MFLKAKEQLLSSGKDIPGDHANKVSGSDAGAKTGQVHGPPAKVTALASNTDDSIGETGLVVSTAPEWNDDFKCIAS
jgi:hypothetical protein